MQPSGVSGRNACEIQPLRDHVVISCENPAKVWQADRRDARIAHDGRNFEISMAMNLPNMRTRFEPALHGLFFNSHASRRDHVAVYLVRHFRQDRLPEANREIVACGFFEIGALPEDTTEGTRLRLAEVLENRELIATWR